MKNIWRSSDFGLQEQEIYQLKKIFEKFDIDKVILFGSRAKGDYKEGSDIDFALISKELRFGDILDIDCIRRAIFELQRHDLSNLSIISQNNLGE